MKAAPVKATSKATHQGHCQVCGACQKLPAGVLAKHGYTTRWGFFEGICPGSSHLPFEQDISLIENAIAGARQQEQGTRERAAAVRTEANPEDCYIEAYFSGRIRGQRSGYRWIKTRIDFPTEIVGRLLCYWHPGDDGKPARWQQTGYYGRDGLADAARHFNGQYADRCLEPHADRLREYALWQEGRIANWGPQSLAPIE